MIRPGVTFALWLAIAILVAVNDAIGDTWIATSLSGKVIEWYKVLVPLPYVAMMAAIHARRTAGPRWKEAAWLAALMWAPSTVLADFLYGRLTFAEEANAIVARMYFWWGEPYAILVAWLFAAPLIAGWMRSRT